MPSITLSQLRNTRLIWALLKAGETIELRERKRVIADFIPIRPWPFPDDEEIPEKKHKTWPIKRWQTSLRRNNPAHGVTPGQHDAAMIYLDRRRAGFADSRQTSSLDQRPAASRAPIRDGLFAEHRPAMAANPFHSFQITGLG
jgi:hypothetical protein